MRVIVGTIVEDSETCDFWQAEISRYMVLAGCI